MISLSIEVLDNALLYFSTTTTSSTAGELGNLAKGDDGEAEELSSGGSSSSGIYWLADGSKRSRAQKKSNAKSQGVRCFKIKI